MKIEVLPITTIKEYENNAKLHPREQIEQIKKSIQEFGNNDPIAIDENNVIIEGHGRYMALKELGFSEIEVIKLTHLTEEKKKAYILAHNKLTMNTDFDIQLLNEELGDIIDIDMSDFGFDLSFDDEEDEVVEDEFDDTPPEEPKSKLGDIYQLGRHRLMCGDSTSVEDVERLMGGYQADLLLTDPPYNVAYEGKTKDALKIQNDSMDNDSFREFLKAAFSAADNVMKPGAVFYIWHADSEGYNFRGACFDIGWTVRQCLIWNKNSMVLGRQDYQWKHEPCLYGWKEGAGHLWASDRKQTTVINFDKPQRNGEHPTMKPVGLFDYQILNNTKGGDIVLDLFGGSGTTIMACEQNGRNGYLMELDPRYVDVIIRRWEEFTGETAVKLN
ncbi:site-specific DNA-methyltransferase [Streptococcus anginosus]|uniref:site-specific DNA-methyltransferase n=1 Tax=Streptococcus anginosus TaxID=1328 RepID=UPI0020018DF1|nr:site-specific DNA-methyltransferase [Streptococcus anginosus]